MYSSLNISRGGCINITDAQIIFLYQPLMYYSIYYILMGHPYFEENHFIWSAKY